MEAGSDGRGQDGPGAPADEATGGVRTAGHAGPCVAAGEEVRAAADVLARLREAGATLATAESLTGGGLGAVLTAVPGSSEVYRGGVVAYATEVKVQVLGVPAAVVGASGVVSADCARAMAAGVRDLLDATYGVATTGVAGPDPQEGRTPGTVVVAGAGPGGPRVAEVHVAGDREEVRAGARLAALRLLGELC